MQIERESMNQEFVDQAFRIVQRAGISPPPPGESNDKTNIKELGKTDAKQRQQEAQVRQQWESSRTTRSDATTSAGSDKTSNNDDTKSYHPRVLAEEKAELDTLFNRGPDGEPEAEAVAGGKSGPRQSPSLAAATRVSALVARSGAGSSFEGETLGIGGLDDVLSQVKRRIWIPLAAGPILLEELGINPVRGLLLYGKPGCGKTLLAQRLGKILSPMRPITVVSGPEIMDKFVGSSEKVRK